MNGRRHACISSYINSRKFSWVSFWAAKPATSIESTTRCRSRGAFYRIRRVCPRGTQGRTGRAILGSMLSWRDCVEIYGLVLANHAVAYDALFIFLCLPSPSHQKGGGGGRCKGRMWSCVQRAKGTGATRDRNQKDYLPTPFVAGCRRWLLRSLSRKFSMGRKHTDGSLMLVESQEMAPFVCSPSAITYCIAAGALC